MPEFQIPFYMAICLLLLSATINASPDDATGIIRVDKERLSGMNLGEYAPYEPDMGTLVSHGHDYFYSETNNPRHKQS